MPSTSKVKLVSFVNFDNADMLLTEFPVRSKDSKLVKFWRGLISEILLLAAQSKRRLISPDKGDKSVTPVLSTLRVPNFSSLLSGDRSVAETPISERVDRFFSRAIFERS